MKPAFLTIPAAILCAAYITSSVHAQSRQPVSSPAPALQHFASAGHPDGSGSLPYAMAAERDEWREAIAGLEEHGLNPQPYLNRFDALSDFRPVTAAPLILQLASDLRYGSDARPDVTQHQQLSDITYQLMTDCDAPAHCLQQLAAHHPDYAPLQAMMRHYRQLAEQGHWPQVADGPALKPGAQDARVPAMRELLRLSGDLPRGVAVRGGQERLYDAPLQEAMRRFQRRHGLTQDAVAGAQTLAALRITPAQRVQQMALALEQMRRSEQPENGIVVNVPQYRLQAFENGREVLAMDVIVGRSDRATPMFDKVIDRLVINPTWTPTRKIINEDLLPKLRDNPSYAYNGGYKVYDRSSGSEVDATRVDWQQVNADDVRLVQKPGRSNALGRIKFMLPDNQAIYLHDTASPRLFSKSERALSSGCIRLSDPEALLDYVLKGQSDTQIERANRAWQKAGDEPELVMLNHSVPVRMAYFSARVNREGEVMFFDDVYGRDAALRKSMQGRLAASPAPR